MRTRLLILASAIGSLGWGAVLPYQYAYAADTRGWGAMVAALASSLFSIGALLAAPIAGRLADKFNPVGVAIVAQFVGAIAVASLVLVGTPGLFLAGMLVFGIGVAASGPARQMLALRWSPSTDRRKVFAYKFTGESLGMAAGAFLAGFVVDLDRTNGLDSGFLMAAAGFVVSALVIALAHKVGTDIVSERPVRKDLPELGGRGAALRVIFAEPAMRWTAVVAITLALGFYAQFESGLPAYALTSLKAAPSAIGIAAAVNCLVIVLLQVVVVRVTAKRSAPTLLMTVGAIWIFSWILLAAAQFMPGLAPAMFVMTYGVFAVGETIYSPVLNPLTASLAPTGMLGLTLGTVTALQTAFSAAGPLVGGLLLGAGLADLYLVLHIAISAIAVFAAWRIRKALRPAPAEPVTEIEPESAPALAAA